MRYCTWHYRPFTFVILMLLSATCLSHAEPVVIVSRHNPIDSLHREDIRNIYLGKIFTFPDGLPVIPLDNSHTLRAHFYQDTCHMTESQVRAWWAAQVFTSASQPPHDVPDDAQIVHMVEHDPRMVGYIESTHINAGVKIVYIVP